MDGYGADECSTLWIYLVLMNCIRMVNIANVMFI
jgi:hypothetical protein